MSRDKDTPEADIAERYAALWHAIETHGSGKRSAADRIDLLDQIRNSLDRKSASLRPKRPEWLAGTFSIESIAFQSETAEILQLRHRDLGTFHGLKTVPTARRDDVVLAQFVRREAETGLRLRHPNLLETTMLLRLGDGRPGILMPWHPVSLALLPVTTKLSHTDALGILRSVLLGLAAMHEEGLVHCDVAPANVLLRNGAGNAAKLSDFGITIPVAARHSDFGIERAGSPDFAAPEQLAGEKAHPKQDVYAFGKLAARILSKMETPIPALDDLVQRCCAQQPEQRPDNVKDIIDSLTT